MAGEHLGKPDGPVLVTGATSQIGQCVLRRLDDGGRPAVAFARKPAAVKFSASARLVVCDLQGRVSEFPDGVSALVHIAAIWLLPAHLDALYEAGVRRLVCFGSTAIYTKPDSVNAGERAVARRMIEAEAQIAERCAVLGIAWTVLRPTLIYGLGIDRNITRAARFIRRFGFYPLATGATGLRQPVHADDLAAAALTALETSAAAGRCYDVGGGERLPYREMIGRIFDALGMPRRFVVLPFLEYAVAGAGLLLRRPEVTGDIVRRMRQDLVCDNGPAEADLDYHPRAFLSGGRIDLGRNFVDTRSVA